MKKLLVGLALALAGCAGPVSTRVKPDLVKALPVESRIELLDAENALFASIDALDAARDGLEDAERQADLADGNVDEAKDQRKRARDTHDATAESVAELAITEANARKQFLKFQQKVLRATLKVREAELDAARGRYELSKAKEVKRVALQGTEALKVDAYEAQVQRLDDRVKAIAADEGAVRADADARKKEWDDARAQLAKATGGAQGSAFVE
jgi:chromosome segregation ATPase